MDYGYLLVFLLAVVGGLVGGVLISWSCLRRLLALEEGFKVVNFATEARIKELERRYLSEEKRVASETRWKGATKKVEEDALKALAAAGNPGTNPHPWDPRTWGT